MACLLFRRNLKRLRDLAAQKCSVVVQRSSWEEPESHLGKTDRGCSSHVCVAAGSLAARPERSADGGSSACSKAGSVLFKKRRRRVIRREEIDSADLVVGDVIEISNGMTLPCDAIVIRGTVRHAEDLCTRRSFPSLSVVSSCTRACLLLSSLHAGLPGSVTRGHFSRKQDRASQSSSPPALRPSTVTLQVLSSFPEQCSTSSCLISRPGCTHFAAPLG